MLAASRRTPEQPIPARVPAPRFPARPPRGLHGAAKSLIIALAMAMAALTTGCVKVYQPVSGLTKPVVVDTGVANFADVDLTIHCPPGDLVDPDEARALCRKVGTLFENQGARVTTFTTDRRQVDSFPGDDLDGTPDEPVAACPTTDLVLELRAHQVHQKTHYLSWVMCYATLSLLPAMAEFTFAQEVVVRDGSGFLLATDTLEGRIVRYGGGGYWLGTKLLDLIVRDKEDRLIGDKPHSDLSRDFYGQLSQTVFNAKMRWRVLEAATSPTSGE